MRLSLLDKINLRSSAVFSAPQAIQPLQIVYGDLTASRIPCSPIDQDLTLFHISDRPMQAITAVYDWGKPITAGFTVYPAKQDETGQSIACIVFQEPRPNGGISISGKGTMKLDTGELIENPADLLKDLFLNVQGYEPTCIDPTEFSRFYADCLKADIKVATVIKTAQVLRSFLDELALNIQASWMMSDGKSVMRLRWI